MVAHGPRKEPDHRVEYDQRRGLTTGQHVVADGDLLADDELTPSLGLRFGGEVEAGTVNLGSLEIQPAFGLTYDHRLRGQGWLWAAWSLQRTEFDAPAILLDHDIVDLDVHTAAALVGLATGPFRIQSDGWRTNVTDLLRLAADLSMRELSA